MSQSVTLIGPATTEAVSAVEESAGTVTLKLRKTKNVKKVKWAESTVDNEHMNKKKSKCCCVYEKPKLFDESSSEESENECDHCIGHTEGKKKESNHKTKPQPSDDSMESDQ